jgi:hypothetical protein
MFVDPCGSDTSMLESFRTLVKPKSGGATEDLMLGSRFVFGMPPEGAFPTRNMTWGDRITLSPRDYGCAWAGRRGDHAFQRDVVRAALEFGVNAAFCVGHSGVGPETEPRRSRGAGSSNSAADNSETEAESKEEAQTAAES